MSKRRKVDFEASTSLFKEIKENNNQVKFILMNTTGEITCWLNVKDFKF